MRRFSNRESLELSLEEIKKLFTQTEMRWLLDIRCCALTFVSLSMFLVNGLRIWGHSTFISHEFMVFLSGRVLAAFTLSWKIVIHPSGPCLLSLRRWVYLIYCLQNERSESSNCIDAEIIGLPKSFQTHSSLNTSGSTAFPSYYNEFKYQNATLYITSHQIQGVNHPFY